MSKNRNQTPDLADFAVHLAEGGHFRKIRASSLIVIEGWLYLRDAGGGILFAAPRESVKYVKRLEPGEVPAPPERLPEPELAVADPGSIEVASPFAAGDASLLPERGGYSSGDRTAAELPPPPDSVTVITEEKGSRRRGERGRFAK